jgi:hypothetical protein
VEDHGVRSREQINDRILGCRRSAVVLGQPPAYVGCGDAHDVVLGGVVARQALKDLGANDALLDFFRGTPLDHLPYGILEESAAAVAAAEELTLHDASRLGL